MKKHTLIFLHGGPGFTDYLAPFFGDMRDEVSVIFFDQMKGPEVSIDHLVEQLDELVMAQNQDIVLIGHSWGATLALEYTKRFERKVSKLIIMSSGLNFRHWKTEFAQEKELRGLIDAPPEMIFLSQSERKDWSHFLDKCWDTFSGETFDSLFSNYISTHDLSETFTNLSIPILGIYGVDDVRFPSRIASELAILNPNFKLHKISDAGHFPFLLENHRKDVKNIILSWI